MSDTNFKEKFASFGGQMSRKMSERMNSVGDKMKELFQVSTQADKIVEDATSEKLGAPDWGKNLELCDMVNAEGLTSQDVVRAIKKRLASKNHVVQLLALVLLETCVKNCEKMFSEVASEKVLDEMVKMVDDPQASQQNRDKSLKMIEAWGEATEELRYLPIFEETYKSLRSRGIRFPGRDEESLAPIFTPPQSVAVSRHTATAVAEDISAHDPKEIFDIARNSIEILMTVLSSSPQKEALKDELTTTLVEQCRQSQLNVQRVIERAGENDSLLFEGLQVNDELQVALKKYDDLSGHSKTTAATLAESRPAYVLAEDDEVDGEEDTLVRTRPSKTNTHQKDTSLDALDEMIFGGKSEASSKGKNKDEDFIKF